MWPWVEGTASIVKYMVISIRKLSLFKKGVIIHRLVFCIFTNIWYQRYCLIVYIFTKNPYFTYGGGGIQSA